ncbi:MAG: carboxymuconolactone decarboxylase family protein [Terriglobales bacterium]
MANKQEYIQPQAASRREPPLAARFAPPLDFMDPSPKSQPRISRLGKEQVDPATREIFDGYLKERGNVPNMFRTVAHRPEIFRTMIAHFRAVMNTGTVPAKLKELVILRTSQLNHCEY